MGAVDGVNVHVGKPTMMLHQGRAQIAGGKRRIDADHQSSILAATPNSLAQAVRGHVFGRFGRDQSGSYVIIVALMMLVLIGLAGLATEGGLWLYTHRLLQDAADSGALSAAVAYRVNSASNLRLQVDA